MLLPVIPFCCSTTNPHIGEREREKESEREREREYAREWGNLTRQKTHTYIDRVQLKPYINFK